MSATTRLIWLEKVLGLEVGKKYGSAPFAGIFAESVPYADWLGTTARGYPWIYINSAKIADPLSAYVIGLHEFAHVAKKYAADSAGEAACNAFVVATLGPDIGFNAAARLLDDIRCGAWRMGFDAMRYLEIGAAFGRSKNAGTRLALVEIVRWYTNTQGKPAIRILEASYENQC